MSKVKIVKNAARNAEGIIYSQMNILNMCTKMGMVIVSLSHLKVSLKKPLKRKLRKMRHSPMRSFWQWLTTAVCQWPMFTCGSSTLMTSYPDERQEPRSVPASKQPREKVIYVQFYVEVFNYLFYVINVVVTWVGAWRFPLLCFCHIDDNPGSQTENESDENLWCFCQKEEYG